MGFSSKRGRPKTKTATKAVDERDLGTLELQAKRLSGVTKEAIDVIREKDLISSLQYSAAMHLRWLYTIRFGAPGISAINLEVNHGREISRNDEIWQAEREREYAMAVEKLRAGGSLKIVMNIVVFNTPPKFINIGNQRSSDIVACGQELVKFRDGLTTLMELWNMKCHK